MHFAQVAFSLLAGGAAVLIVAGLVLEAVHDKKGPTRQHGAASDPLPRPAIPPRPVVQDVVDRETMQEAGAFAHSRGGQRSDNKRRKKRNGNPGEISRRSARASSAESEGA